MRNNFFSFSKKKNINKNYLFLSNLNNFCINLLFRTVCFVIFIHYTKFILIFYLCFISIIIIRCNIN